MSQPAVPPKLADTLAALRERYRASIGNTVAAFRRIAALLAATPDAPEVVDVLRRELHRVHGAAGSYGFPEASQLAAELEERAVRWAADPSLDRGRRASIIEHFAGALEARVGGAPAPLGELAAGAAPAASGAPGPDARPSTDGPLTPAAPGGAPPAAGRAPDVLVVEDDPALADMLRYALETAGFSFQHYATGPEALTALLGFDTGGRRPVILLDVDLPGLDGFTLHERLRVERPGAYATVFLTARGGEAEQLRAYRAGAIDYLAKPVNMRILVAKLPSWLDRAGRGS